LTGWAGYIWADITRIDGNTDAPRSLVLGAFEAFQAVVVDLTLRGSTHLRVAAQVHANLALGAVIEICARLLSTGAVHAYRASWALEVGLTGSPKAPIITAASRKSQDY
jgi:hypothetical protein